MVSMDSDECHQNLIRVGSNTVCLAQSPGLAAQYGISAGVGVPQPLPLDAAVDDTAETEPTRSSANAKRTARPLQKY